MKNFFPWPWAEIQSPAQLASSRLPPRAAQSVNGRSSRPPSVHPLHQPEPDLIRR
jgi:hypothetical protein